MYFDIIGYTDRDIRKVIISEIESIKEVMKLFDILQDLLQREFLHPDIKRLKCYVVDHEKILDVAEAVSDGYNVHPKGKGW